MIRLLLFKFIWIALPFVLFSQSNGIQVSIYVYDIKTNKQLSEAIVELYKSGNYEEPETTKVQGLAVFNNYSKGNYLLSITREGYEGIFIYNPPIMVTDENKQFRIGLTPLPLDSFEMRGKILDFEDEEPIDSAKVLLTIAGRRQQETLSNKWGYFQFLFNKQDVESSENFSIDISKENYQNISTSKPLYSRNINIDVSKLKKNKIQRKNKLTNIFVNTYKIPMVSIGIAPDINLFLDGNPVQFKLTTTFTLSVHFLIERKLFSIGGGWRMPIKLTTLNSYQTLTGLNSIVESRYIIEDLGFVNIQYYQNIKSRKYTQYFIGLAGYYVKQKPNSTIIYQDSHIAEISSYFNFVPKVSSGISIRQGRFVFEPNLSISYFKLNSQNIKFNYFGWADKDILKKHFVQIGFGLNMRYTLYYYGNEK